MAKIHLNSYGIKADVIGSKETGGQYLDIEIKLNFDSIGNMDKYIRSDGSIDIESLEDIFRQKMSVMYDKNGSISLD